MYTIIPYVDDESLNLEQGWMTIEPKEMVTLEAMGLSLQWTDHEGQVLF